MSVAKPPGQKLGHGDGARQELVTQNNVPADLQPPAHLGAIGTSVWAHVVAEANQWLQPSDLPVLLLLCEGYERRALYLEDIETNGVTVEETTREGNTKLAANPAVAMLEKLEAQLTRWLSLLGLSPSDRGRLGLQQSKTESTLERLRQSRSGTSSQTVSGSQSTRPQSRKRQSKRATASES